MLSLILQKCFKRSKSVLPNPNFEYRLIFKKGIVEEIKRMKGWKTDADMGRALGLTRAYITMLRSTRTSVTATVITRLAAQMNNIERNWWIYFEIIPWGVIDPNHPVWNDEKYKGRMPYSRYSLSAQGREKDYQVETEKKPLTGV